MRLMVGETKPGRKTRYDAYRALAPKAPPRIFQSSAVPRILGLMDDLEKLRAIVGPEANGWTTAQLEQLSRDIDAMAAILLDFDRSLKPAPNSKACGSPNVDVRQPDR
jgi:hypothetical protein